MNTKMKASKELLEARGLRPTYPRLKILEYLEKHENHPTVIYSITITGTETRYDHRDVPHHHLLCKRCGKIIDVDIKCPYVEDKEIDGHRIEERYGYFKGICKECLKKRTKR